MPVSVDQSEANAGGDVVAGNKSVVVYESAKVISIVESLLTKLKIEVSDNSSINHTIDALKYFHEKKPSDGIVGLEAKLTHGGRHHEIWSALDKKEQFSKLLDKWSLYLSAQELFAFLLARAEHQFTMFVYPQLDELRQIEINAIVDSKIINPTIDECGTSVFTINHNIAMGMVYWLAEQCFIRWHK